MSLFEACPHNVHRAHGYKDEERAANAEPQRRDWEVSGKMTFRDTSGAGPDACYRGTLYGCTL